MEVVSEAVSKPEKCTIIFCKQDLLLYIFRKAVRVNGGLDIPETRRSTPWRNGLKRQIEQGFFFIFCYISWFFKVEHTIGGAAKLWKIIKYAKNMVKNEEKPIIRLAYKPIFWLIPAPGTQSFTSKSPSSSTVRGLKSKEDVLFASQRL